MAIMPFPNNNVKQSWKAKIDRKDGENSTCMAHVQMLQSTGVMWACVWLPSDDIYGNQKHHMNLQNKHALVLTHPALSSRVGT